MGLGRYLLGTGELVLIVGAIGLGALRLRARWLPGWSGAPARLAEIVIATGALVIVLEIAGVAQLLRPVPVLIIGTGGRGADGEAGRDAPGGSGGRRLRSSWAAGRAPRRSS